MKEQAQAARKASTEWITLEDEEVCSWLSSPPQELSSIEHSLPTKFVTTRSTTAQARD